MKLLWLGYLVYSLGNCAIKLCIETGLMHSTSEQTHTFDSLSRCGWAVALVADLDSRGLKIRVETML